MLSVLSFPWDNQYEYMKQTLPVKLTLDETNSYSIFSYLKVHLQPLTNITPFRENRIVPTLNTALFSSQ